MIKILAIVKLSATPCSNKILSQLSELHSRVPGSLDNKGFAAAIYIIDMGGAEVKCLVLG